MLTLKETLDTLKKLGHNPNKSFGQNFLVDKNIVGKTIEISKLTPDDRVIEIGPGLGTLTSAILATGAKLVSIERDTHLLPHLQETFAGNLKTGQFQIINQDATKVDYTQFKSNTTHPLPPPTRRGDIIGANAPLPLVSIWGKTPEYGFKIVANLPYSVATPLLERFLLGLPQSMTLMIQREPAERWAATSGKQFSAISIFLQSAYEGGIAHSVGRKCFFPPPAVDSVIVHYELKRHPVIFPPERQRLVRTLFLNRRKQLRKGAQTSPISKEWFEELLKEGKIKPTVRAEEIELIDWQALT